MEDAVKAITLIAVALALALPGCAKNKSAAPQNTQEARLAGLESSFARFQEQQRARDADLEFRLREIASRLERLPQGQPIASQTTRKAKGRTSRQPASMGQIVAYAPAMQQAAAAPASQYQPPAAVGAPVAGAYQPPVAAAPGYPLQAAPVAPAPVAAVPPAPSAPIAAVPPVTPAPAPGAAPAASQYQPPVAQAAPGTAPVASAPAPQAQAVSAPGLLPLNPPVVSLGDPARYMTPSAPVTVEQRQPAAPVPMETPRGAKARRPARTPQPVSQEEPGPSPVPVAVPTAPQPAIPGLPAQAQPPAAAAPSFAPQPAAPVAAPPSPSSPQPQSATSDVHEQQLYTEALRSVSSSKNEDGRKKFNEFLAKYPSSSKAPEALYWIGESYMGEKSYNQAVLSFKEVTTRFPKEGKAAEALWRTAEAYERLGDKTNAAFHLKMLADEYPNSEFNGKARQKLKQLGQ